MFVLEKYRPRVWTTLGGIVASVALCPMASPDAGGELRSALEHCEVERTQCRTELASVASTLEQCRSEPGRAAGDAAPAGGTPPGCAHESGHTFVLVRASWTTSADVDLYVVDPGGREFMYSARTHAGSPAVFEEDSTHGPGNEIWVHPRAEEGRYRVCYRLFTEHRGGSQPSVRGSVLWKGGSVGIGEVGLRSDGEMRMGVEFVVDSQGNVTMDRSGTDRFLGTGACAS